MSFTNIRIGKKLGIGFGLLIVLMIVICAVSIINSQMTNSMLVRSIENKICKGYHSKLPGDCTGSGESIEISNKIRRNSKIFQGCIN